MQPDFVGQGWMQLAELALASLLSALIGLERELRQKSAGLRTYTLVGVASALFMLVSKYGFMNILVAQRVVVDPSRIAAQIVSGIGFIGGGVIFMRRDVVRGLTTAASVWLTAAVGMACGAGLPILAVATTAGHFIVMFIFPRLVRRLPQARRATYEIAVCYEDGRGLLREILLAASELRFAIHTVRLDPAPGEIETGPLTGERTPPLRGGRPVSLRLGVRGKRPASDLVGRLASIDGVLDVGIPDEEGALD